MKTWRVLLLLLCLFLIPVLTEAQTNGTHQTASFGTVHTVPVAGAAGYVNWGTNTNFGTTYQLFGITPVTGFDFTPPLGGGPPNTVAGGDEWTCTVRFAPANAGTYSGTITLDYIAPNTGQHLYLTVSVSGTYAP